MDSKGEQRMMKREASFGDEYHRFEEEDGVDDDDIKKKKVAVICDGASGGGSVKKNGVFKCCQVENCSVDLSKTKQYYKKHKVCENHSKAQVVLVAGIRQRFCQQCSRFHELPEFDDTKRSCRRRLAGHNERRRKSSAESHREGSSRKGAGMQMKDMVCGQVNYRRKIALTVQEMLLTNISRSDKHML